MIEAEIKIMPYIGYNQIQAYQWGLNHVQGIIMNYFSFWLPNYGETIRLKGSDGLEHTFFWMSITKPSIDMPTLQIKEGTYRENIRSLLELGVLDRQVATVGGVSRAYYRVTDKWMKSGTQTYPSDFNTLYNTLESNIKRGEMSKGEIEKLHKLFSLYVVEKEKKETKMDIDVEMDDGFSAHILAEIKRGASIFDVKQTIDINWVKENIIDQIKLVGSRSSWFKYGPDGKTADDDTKRKILRHFSKMIDWYIGEKRKIRGMKATINQWFGTDKI